MDLALATGRGEPLRPEVVLNEDGTAPVDAYVPRRVSADAGT
jgi:hypothetical protein